MAGEPADPAESPRADSKSEQRSSQQTTLQGVPNWEKLARHVRRVARSLVENPVYLAALQRRLDDQRAPRMVKYFWQLADERGRHPQKWQRRMPPLDFIMKYIPGEHDPLAEQEKVMIAAQEAQEEQEARERQEARSKQSAATAASPEEPSDPNDLQLVRDI